MYTTDALRRMHEGCHVVHAGVCIEQHVCISSGGVPVCLVISSAVEILVPLFILQVLAFESRGESGVGMWAG